MRNKTLVNNDYYMYLDDSDLSNIIINNRTYEENETELIKSILRPTDIALDIGTHIGYFTLLMAKRCELVYAFEPEPNNFNILKENIKLNNLENQVIIFDSVITDYSDCYDPKIQKLYLCSINSGMHRIYPHRLCDKSIDVKAIQIDDMGFNEIDFIKMDIEGSELGALKGMKNLLKNNDIKMIMEFHPPSIREYGANPKDVYDFMTELGYNIDLIGHDGKLSYDELVNKTSDPKGGSNLYCYR